jgi:hypothetical protein
MAIETLGEAYRLGWQLIARCIYGYLDLTRCVRKCHYSATLDMQTMVWTRGRNFPISRLSSRLMCPRCRCRDVSLMFSLPGTGSLRQGGRFFLRATKSCQKGGEKNDALLTH